jgi:Domain of unknown function (DUF4852)
MKTKVQPQHALNLYIATGLLTPILTSLSKEIKDWVLTIRSKIEAVNREERSTYDFQQRRIEAVKKLIDHLNNADQDRIILIQQYLEEFLDGRIMQVADTQTRSTTLYTIENIEAVIGKIRDRVDFPKKTKVSFENAVSEILAEL